jgi:hypothetical protein
MRDFLYGDDAQFAGLSTSEWIALHLPKPALLSPLNLGKQGELMRGIDVRRNMSAS